MKRLYPYLLQVCARCRRACPQPDHRHAWCAKHASGPVVTTVATLTRDHVTYQLAPCSHPYAPGADKQRSRFLRADETHESVWLTVFLLTGTLAPRAGRLPGLDPPCTRCQCCRLKAQAFPLRIAAGHDRARKLSLTGARERGAKYSTSTLTHPLSTQTHLRAACCQTRRTQLEKRTSTPLLDAQTAPLGCTGTATGAALAQAGPTTRRHRRCWPDHLSRRQQKQTKKYNAVRNASAPGHAAQPAATKRTGAAACEPIMVAQCSLLHLQSFLPHCARSLSQPRLQTTPQTRVQHSVTQGCLYAAQVRTAFLALRIPLPAGTRWQLAEGQGHGLLPLDSVHRHTVAASRPPYRRRNAHC